MGERSHPGRLNEASGKDRERERKLHFHSHYSMTGIPQYPTTTQPAQRVTPDTPCQCPPLQPAAWVWGLKWIRASRFACVFGHHLLPGIQPHLVNAVQYWMRKPSGKVCSCRTVLTRDTICLPSHQCNKYYTIYNDCDQSRIVLNCLPRPSPAKSGSRIHSAHPPP